MLLVLRKQKQKGRLRRKSAFQLSDVKQKPTQSEQPITRKENFIRSQWELRVKTSQLPEARENTSDKVAVDFS